MFSRIRSKLVSLWTWITNIGIEEDYMEKEVVRYRLLNQLIFLTLFTSLLALGTYLIWFEGITIILTTLGNISVELVGLYLAFRGKHRIVRHIAVLFFPSLIAVHVLILGGNFGEAHIFTAFGLGAFILYEEERRLRAFAIAYICTLFISTKLYVIQRFYDSGYKYNPYDDILTFIMILFILGLMLYLYQKELRNYEADRKKLISDLEEKNRTLSFTNRELEQFTYIASHDLKTPLRTISGHLDLIRRHLATNELAKMEEDIEYAKTGVRQMYLLISDILEYKKIQELPAPSERVDLDGLVSEVSGKLQDFFQRRSAKVVNRGLPVVRVNRHDFSTLFQNLIENGVKYNHSAVPTVTLSSSLEGDLLKLDFKDNGIGIDPKYHEEVFRYFKRLHSGAEYEGTGIGLGLCKKVVGKYRGEIHIDSAEGRGTTLSVRLPANLVVKKL